MMPPEVPSVPLAVVAPPDPDERPRVARDDTDDSLRTERDTADGAVTEMRALEEHADRVLDVARSLADSVLTKARDKADIDLEAHESGQKAVVAEERARADASLEFERAAQDETLRREREDYAQAFLALLPLERESTNRNLLMERARSDAAVSQRDDFLGMVSHDLNNLLAGIVLSAGNLARKAPPTPEGEPIVANAQRIQLYAARMRRLIGDLVDVTSIEAGKLAVAPFVGDARAVVREAVDTFRLRATEKGIALEADLGDEPLALPFDRDRLLQVFANLMANAIKFTAPGGVIHARAHLLGGEVLFTVSDTGCGIPAGLLEAVFERFWQAGKDDRRGLGLGLYIAKNIVEAHGGSIWAESRVGEGSSFHFTLPLGGRSH
jgi:signal transduction histidine kinase